MKVLAGMTTSKETEGLDHPAIRRAVDEAKKLSPDELRTLLKGLIILAAAELPPGDFGNFAEELRLKGERFYEAKSHPGTGKAERHVRGEREIEGRS